MDAKTKAICETVVERTVEEYMKGFRDNQSCHRFLAQAQLKRRDLPHHWRAFDFLSLRRIIAQVMRDLGHEEIARLSRPRQESFTFHEEETRQLAWC